MGRIFMSYLCTGAWFGPGIVATLLFSPSMGCTGVVVMAIVNCPGAGGCVI